METVGIAKKVCNPDSPSSQSDRRLLTSFALEGL